MSTTIRKKIAATSIALAASAGAMALPASPAAAQSGCQPSTSYGNSGTALATCDGEGYVRIRVTCRDSYGNFYNRYGSWTYATNRNAFSVKSCYSGDLAVGKWADTNAPF